MSNIIISFVPGRLAKTECHRRRGMHSMPCSAEYSVSDVAKLVGYENEASFRRVFKEKYGVSVGEYCKNAVSGTGQK